MLCVSISFISANSVGLHSVSGPPFRAIHCRYLGCSENNLKVLRCFHVCRRRLNLLTQRTLVPLWSNRCSFTVSPWHSVILTMVRCVNFGCLPSHGTIALPFGTNTVCNFSTKLLGVNLNLCYHVVVALGN